MDGKDEDHGDVGKRFDLGGNIFVQNFDVIITVQSNK